MANFEKAVDFVGKHLSSHVTPTQDQQLGFYGLYKRVTVGKCNISKPWAWDMVGKAKWSAWKKCDELSEEEAKQRYIAQVESMAPEPWAEFVAGGGTAEPPGGPQPSGAGPVFSCQKLSEEEEAYEEEMRNTEHKPLWYFASEGKNDEVVAMLERGVADIDGVNEDGLTALHFAADRGHAQLARSLLDASAAIDVQDADGQTALHYALMCEHTDLVKLLLENGASKEITTADGEDAVALAEGNSALLALL